MQFFPSFFELRDDLEADRNNSVCDLAALTELEELPQQKAVIGCDPRRI
jgi:hypothetical protein